MVRLSVLLALGLSLVLAVVAMALWPLANARGAAEQGFEIGVIGDIRYIPEQDDLDANLLDEVNKAPLDFVVHLGDLAFPPRACRDDFQEEWLAQFQASRHPLIYTPGDNEWTDCHDAQGVPGGNPLERLARIRTLFFPTDQTLGRRTVPVWRQSGNPAYAKFRENARFSFRDVMVATVHLVGSNNNYRRTPEMDAEWAERNHANVVWLIDTFDEARRLGNKGVLLFTQANLFPEFPPTAGNPTANSGFADFRKHLMEQTIAFGKPVVLVHGDSHYFRVDKPLRYPGTPQSVWVENFTRVEGFGSANHHWLQVTVDPSDPNVFIIRQRIVEKNRYQSAGR